MSAASVKKKAIDRNLAGIYYMLLMLALWGIQFVPEGIQESFLEADMLVSTAISESLIALPAILMLGVWYVIHSYRSTISDEPMPRISDRLMYRGVKGSTILMTFLYALTLLPLITLCNAITMLFTENAVLQESAEILDMSVPVAVFTIAVLPACLEELAFRGFVFGGYRRDCRPVGAIVMSALLFGLMHGNINQFVYAFVIGMALALLAEATGSIWPGMLVHFLINIRAVLAMFILDSKFEGIFEEYMEEGIGDESMTLTIIIYAVLSVITTLMAGAIISWVSQNEGRDNPLKLMLNNRSFRTTHRTVWTPPLVIGILLSIAYIVIVEFFV